MNDHVSAPGGSEAVLRLIEGDLGRRSQDAGLVRDLGHRIYQQGDSVTALRVLARAVELGPRSIDIRLTQLQVAANSDDRPGAAALAEAAVQDFPDDARIAHFAARALRKNRNFARAAALWRFVAQARPNDPAPLIDAAGSLIRCRDLVGAAECAQQAAERDPTSIEALALQVQTLRGLNRPEALGEAVERLASLDPARVLEHLPALMASGRYEAIASVLLRCHANAVAVDERLLTQLLRILRNVVQLMEAEGRREEAALVWTVIATCGPPDPKAQENARRGIEALADRGFELAALGQADAAANTLRKVLSLDPKLPLAAKRLAELLEQRGAGHEAAEAWLAYAEATIAADRIDAVEKAGALASRSHDVTEGLQVLMRARSLEPGNATIQGWIKTGAERCLQATSDALAGGDYAAAVAGVRALMAYDPHHSKLARLRRRLLGELGLEIRAATDREDTEAARVLCVLTVEIDPESDQALKLLGDAALKAQRFTDAAERYEQLARLQPKTIRHLERLAHCYRHMREPLKAAEAFERLLRLDPTHSQARERLAELQARLGPSASNAPKPAA